MRKVTLAVATIAFAACSEPTSRVTAPIAHPTTANLTVIGTDGSPTPSAGDKVIVDTRTSLQSATSLAQAEALFRGNDHTDARTASSGWGWAFVKNFDGAGTSALRADWPTAKRCTDETNRIINYFPDPLPKTLFVQWKTRFGRHPKDAGGNGAVNAYTIETPTCPNAAGYGMTIFRDDGPGGPDQAFKLFYDGSPATAEFEQHALGDIEADGNQGWTFAPSGAAGQTVKFTMYIQAESGRNTRDGVLRMWINGRLYFEALNLSVGSQGMDRFEFPGWRFGTVAESEYIWDVLAWSSVPLPTTSMVVTPASSAIDIGNKVQLSATGYDANGNTASTGVVKWTSDATKIATIDANGMVTGKAPGIANITATAGKLTAAAVVTVNPPTPAKITVRPGAASVKVGNTVKLSAAVTDTKNKPMTVAVTWTSADPTIASVADDGTVTGVAGGKVKVTASVGTLSDDAMITVTAPPPPKITLAVKLGSANLTTGQTTQANYTIQLPAGYAMASAMIKPAWSSDNTTVATVSATGLVTAVGPGTANVIAKLDDLTGQATVTVTSPGGNPAPGPNATILLDMRHSLQTAATIDQAFALFGIVDHTPYRDANGPNQNGSGWSFTTNADGHGLHALRADWAQSPYYNGYTSTGPTPLPCPVDDGGCHDQGLRVIHYLPEPKPIEVYAQWKGRFGKFATDADANGTNNSYAMWPQTDACKRALFDRADDKNRVDYTFGRFLPEQSKVEMGDHNYARLDNTNLWSPNAAGASGATFTTTVHVRASSADGVADGVFQLWIDGKLILDYHDVPAEAEPFDRWSFPETCVTVSQPQSEYFWDILVWRP